MNKRKRVATLKHRRRLIKYEKLRKEAVRKGTPLAEVAHRRPARPRVASPPLQGEVKAVEAAAPAQKTRRAAVVKEKPVAEAAAPAQKTRRAAVAKEKL